MLTETAPVSAAPLRVKRKTVVYDVSKSPAAPAETPAASRERASAKRQAEHAAAVAALNKLESRSEKFLPPPSPELDAARERLRALGARQAELTAGVKTLTARAEELRTVSRAVAASVALGDEPAHRGDEASANAAAADLERDSATEELAAIVQALPTQRERVEVAKAAHAKVVHAAAATAQRACLVRLLKQLEALHALGDELRDIATAARRAGREVPAIPSFRFPCGSPAEVNSGAWLFVDALRRGGFADLPGIESYP